MKLINYKDFTNKENKSFNRLREIINLSKKEIRNNDRNSFATLNIYDLKDLNIVLNLIVKLKKDNMEKDKQIKKDKDLKRRLCKEVNQVFEEVEEKDKIIDLMAEFINKQDIDEDICKNNMNDLCDEYGTGINCISCIKKHFQNLSRKDS